MQRKKTVCSLLKQASKQSNFRKLFLILICIDTVSSILSSQMTSGPPLPFWGWFFFWGGGGLYGFIVLPTIEFLLIISPKISNQFSNDFLFFGVNSPTRFAKVGSSTAPPYPRYTPLTMAWLHINTILEDTHSLRQNFISSFLLFPKAISSFKLIYLTCIQDETTAKITIL